MKKYVLQVMREIVTATSVFSDDLEQLKLLGDAQKVDSDFYGYVISNTCTGEVVSKTLVKQEEN